MITGSQASAYYGEPRFTRDIHIVANIKPKQVEGFVSYFPPNEFSTPFSQTEFARRNRCEVFPDQDAYFASPEDVIIKKMEYYKEGGSEKHLRDITGILKVSGESVDRGYITDWAKRLDLSEIWNAILERLSKR